MNTSGAICSYYKHSDKALVFIKGQRIYGRRAGIWTS